MDAAREVENEFDPETVMIKKTSKEFSHMKDPLLWSSVAVSGRITVQSNRENGSDLILLQNGIYFAQKERMGTVSGAVYVLDDDKRLRGLRDAEMDARIKIIGYDTLTDIITSGVRVTGMF